VRLVAHSAKCDTDLVTMLGTQLALFGSAVSLFAVLGCSAGPAAGSETTGHRGGSGNAASAGSGNGSSIVPSAGAPSINTDSGETMDAGDCGSTLEVLYRDFKEARDAQGHPDFEMTFAGDVVRRGLVESALGPDRKPVFKESVGHPPLVGSPTAIDPDWNPTMPAITSAASFKQWYNTSDINRALPKTLALTESAPGTGIFGYESSSFFPLAPDEGFGITPAANDMGMNFLFTTEIHVQFTYKANQKFTFRGDDDLWIFVNGQLALDLGSMHGPEEGTIDFDAQAASLNISVGGFYQMDVFHAERHMRGSNFKITTNIACFTPSIVK
jgi:fibro-slime domain-containing protein